MKRLLVLLLIAALICTGCRSHVDSSNMEFEDGELVAFDNANFYVPFDMTDAKDYNSIIGVQYDTAEDRDIARMSLVNGSIKGATTEGILFTNPREYMFYVGKCNSELGNIENASRDTLLSACARQDIEYVKYGRCIENNQGVPKAIMRVTYRVTDAVGGVTTFDGYLGVAKCSGSYYFYLAGYSGIADDAEQLKLCFNYARSLE